LFRQWNHQKFLFTGDLEKEGEEKLIQDYPNLKVDVLKVGHHGSQTSTSDHFIQSIQVKTALISVGKKNHFGHPHKDSLQTLQKYGAKIYMTKDSGALYYHWYPLLGLSEKLELTKEDEFKRFVW